MLEEITVQNVASYISPKRLCNVVAREGEHRFKHFSRTTKKVAVSYSNPGMERSVEEPYGFRLINECIAYGLLRSKVGDDLGTLMNNITVEARLSVLGIRGASPMLARNRYRELIVLARGNKYCMFNQHGKWQALSLNEIISKPEVKVLQPVLDVIGYHANTSKLFQRAERSLYASEYYTKLEMPALSSLKTGDTIDTYTKLWWDIALHSNRDTYLYSMLIHPCQCSESEAKPQSIDELIVGIDHPAFHQDPENKVGGRKFFDYVKVEVVLSTSYGSDGIKAAKQNIKAITMRVLKHIENQAKFKKYGIPINFLSVQSIGRHGYSLTYTLGLKPEAVRALKQG